METAFLIYFICFGVGLLFTLASGLLAGVFGGHDFHDGSHAHAASHAHAEAGLGDHDMPGFSPWSPTTLASFATAFGGLGMILDRIPATRHPLISGPLAALGGLGVAGAVFLIFSTLFRRTQGSSEGRVRALVGQTAILNCSLPPGGVGEIAYIQGGTRYTGPARAESGAAMAAGTTVVITRVVGSEFFVRLSGN